MRQFTCEVCGNTDIIKREGIFVCQSCGCKYSLDEVRKLLSDNPIAVQETEKSNKTTEYNNMLRAAYDAMVDERFESAYSNSIRLLSINPDDPELIAMQALAILGKERMASDIPSSTINGMSRFYTMVRNWKEEFPRQIEAYKHVLEYIKSSCNAQGVLLREERDSLSDQKHTTSTSEKIGDFADALGLLAGDPLSYGHGMSSQNERQRRDAYNRAIENQIEKIHTKEQKLYNFRTSHTSKMEVLIKETQEADKKYKEQRRMAYWETHADQKAELEANISRLIEERNPILNEIKNKEKTIRQLNDSSSIGTPLRIKEKELDDEIHELRMQLIHLGLFDGRKKKQINKRIDDLKNQKPTYEQFREESNEIMNKVQPQINTIKKEVKDLKQESDALSKKIEALQNELQMDR